MDGRPNRRNKAAFSNSSGIVWTRLWSSLLDRACGDSILTLHILVNPHPPGFSVIFTCNGQNAMQSWNKIDKTLIPAVIKMIS